MSQLCKACYNLNGKQLRFVTNIRPYYDPIRSLILTYLPIILYLVYCNNHSIITKDFPFLSFRKVSKSGPNDDEDSVVDDFV